MKIITRNEAIKQGKTRYYTGKPCLNGHLSERRVSNCLCLKCDSERLNAKRKAMRAAA